MVEKPGILEQHKRTRGTSIGTGQVTGEGQHADTEEQAQFEDTITAQCPLAALRTRDKAHILYKNYTRLRGSIH